MKRTAAVLLAFAVSACASTGPASAQHPAPSDGASPPTLQVSATAIVERAPDRAVIQLAVETVAGTAGAASEQNAERMQAVLDAVLGQGVSRSAIRTQRLELHPRYDHRRDEEPEIVGYQAVNQVTVQLDDVALAGPVVDAAVGAGANRVTGIRFELSDPSAAYHEALREAIARARAEAEVAASALGMQLGIPQSVSTGGGPAPVPQAAAMRMDAEAVLVPPVEAGQIEVRASVSINWRLET